MHVVQLQKLYGKVLHNFHQVWNTRIVFFFNEECTSKIHCKCRSINFYILPSDAYKKKIRLSDDCCREVLLYIFHATVCTARFKFGFILVVKTSYSSCHKSSALHTQSQHNECMPHSTDWLISVFVNEVASSHVCSQHGQCLQQCRIVFANTTTSTCCIASHIAKPLYYKL